MGRTSVMAGMILVLAGWVSGPGAAAGDPLAVHRSKSRILLIAAPEAADPKVRAQREALAAARAAATERDLVVEAIGRSAQAAGLRARFELPEDAFRAVLVGKDGSAKLVSEEPIPPPTLFATIDAMPMRRDEMRRR